MATKKATKNPYHAKCSRCGAIFRAPTKATLLSKLRTHLWAKHRAWMVIRIKAGQKRGQLVNPTAQLLLGKVMQGVFPMVPPPSKHADRAIAIVDTAVGAARAKVDPKVLLVWASFKAMYRFRKFGKEIETG